MLIVLAGLPGVGKTSIARELARQLGAVHIRIDSIELAILAAGVSMASMEDVGYRVAYAVGEDNLRLGRVVIADSVNALPETRDAWRAIATRAEVTAVDVEITCSDEREHRRRVEQRLELIPALSGPTWEDVVARDYRPWDRERIVIDTAGRTVEEGVAIIVRSVVPAGTQPPGHAEDLV